MKKYEIRQSERFSKIYPGETRYIIINNELPNNPVFSGYDFMGSPEWDEDELGAYFMDQEEAEAIRDDLEAAEDIQHFSFGKLCETMGLNPEVMQDYHGGPVPQEAYLK